MALVNINDVAVLSGSISMPLIGMFTADLVIDQPDGEGFDAGTSVSIEAADGVTLSGTVVPDRTGDYLDAVHVRVIGGKGGMATEATPRAFAQPSAFVRDIVNALLGDAGETISSTADAALLGTNLVAWAIFKAPVSQALVALLDIVAPTHHWRMLSDGTLWIGQESWPTEEVTYEIINHNPSDGTLDLGVDSPAITPGITVDGVGKINRVEHQISAEKIRSHVWLNIDDEERGLKAAVTSITRQATSRIDYFGLYDARLVSQSADLSTVDVTPADPRLGGMSRVPLRLGLPGIKAQVSPGATLRIGWDRGNPQYPFASLWNGGETVVSLQVDATLINLGGLGGEELVKKAEFNNHVHLGASTVCANGAAWTGSTNPPTVPAVGTTKVKAV